MTPSRREFMRRMGCGVLGTAAFVTGVDRFFSVTALAAPAVAGPYKALVCIFMFGGNDGNNTVIPIDDYGDYAAVRGSLTIPQAQLLAITPPSDGRRFGLHPTLTRLHGLWQQRKVAIVTNVGPLVEPLTRDQFRNLQGRRPYQLFSLALRPADGVADILREWPDADGLGRARGRPHPGRHHGVPDDRLGGGCHHLQRRGAHESARSLAGANAAQRGPLAQASRRRRRGKRAATAGTGSA